MRRAELVNGSCKAVSSNINATSMFPQKTNLVTSINQPSDNNATSILHHTIIVSHCFPFQVHNLLLEEEGAGQSGNVPTFYIFAQK